MMPTRPKFWPGFLHARLSSTNDLGLHLTVGVVTLLVAMLVFGIIAKAVTTAGPLVTLDLQISAWFHAHAQPLLTTFFLLLTDLHNTVGALTLAFLFTLYLVKKRAWDWVLCMALAVPLGMLLNVLLKNVFQRARPTFEHPLLSLTTYSFPSGHTAAAALLYGMVGAYLVCICRGWRRLLAAVVALSMVALVGLSRIYLGVHYFSDVVAATASSTGWLAVVLTAVVTWRKRQARLTPSP